MPDSQPSSPSFSYDSQSSGAAGAQKPPVSPKPEQSFLAKGYFWLEDRYYDVCDFLQNAGIPVYKYWVEPLESRGVPSFPVTVGVLVLLLLLLWLLMQPAPLVDLAVKVVSGGKVISGANVSLSYDGNLVWRYSSVSGSANFPGLKPGTRVLLNASKQGYVPVRGNQSFVLENSRTVSFEMVAPSLANLEQPSNSLVVNVFFRDEKGVRRNLEGVKLVYSSAEGVELGTATTDAAGSVTLMYDGANSLVFLDLEKEGFEPVRGVGVFFAKKKAEIEMAPTGKVQTARLIVQVRNSKGSAVVSTVSLFSFDGTGPLEVLQTDAAGQAEFSVELGTKAFVNAVPVSQGDKDKYNPYYGEDAVFSVNSSPYNFQVALKDKDGSFGKAVIRVLEASSNQTLPGVEVTLYDAFSKRYLDKANTDASGEASFGIPNTTTAYATAYASGFLPEGVVNVKAGTTKTVYLRRATANNSGFARVSVTEQNGTLVSGAFVNLHRYLDEFPLGLPQQATNASGFVVFSSVPSNFDLFAQAIKGARSGRSAGKFIVSPSQTQNVTVVLDAGSGNVSTTVKDAYSGKVVSGAQVFATASSGGALLSSCTTDSNGNCLMQVKSYVAFTVAAAAGGYKNSSSQQVAMAVDSSRFVSLSIVPLGKENELFVNLTSVVDDATGGEVSFLERGKTYRAKFVANFPSNLSGANGTFYARLGGEGSASDSDFIVLDASASGSLGTARGEQYLPSSCPNEAIAKCADASAGGCKWVQLNFANVSGTTANPEVIFQVRPVNVSAAQVASVFYRVFAKVSANGSINYLRSPADTYLPVEGDSCNATTKAFTIPLAAGVTTCSDAACLTLVFKKDGVEYGEGFNTTLGSSFAVEVRARQLQPAGGLQFLNLSYSPHAKYLSLPSGWSQLLDGTLQASSTSSINSSINFNASIPSLALGARVSANYSLGNLAVSARYTITGADWLVVSAVATQKGVAQTNLYAGEANDLAVSVNTSLGVPVANATVFLNNEDSAGSPAVFNTLPASISGDNSSGKGRDGLYVFAGVVPVNEGKAKVQAVRGISGQTLVDVESRPFLEVSPGFIYVCSATPLPSFKVSNQLATPVSVDIGVRKGCVEKIGPASFPQPDPNFDNYTISFSTGESVVPITPLASTENDCTIFLNSSFAGQTVERQIQYVSDLNGACDYGPLPTCTLNPSVSNLVGPFSSELSATYSNVPSGITSATIYCNAADTTGVSVPLVESGDKKVATRVCSYPAAPGSTSVLHGAKASISSTPEIQIGAGVGECAAQVTVRPMPTGADFVIDQSGVIMAITPSATMEITPLIPANAIKVSVKNEMAVGPASVLFNYDQACFKLLKLDGSTPASSDYDVPAGATKEYALLFNYEAASCSSPEFTSSGDALRFSKSDLMAETLTAGFGGKTASVSLSVKSSNQDTAVYSLARVAIDPATYSFVSTPAGLYRVFSAFANNMQAPRMNVLIKPNSDLVNTAQLPQGANVFQVLYSLMAARTFRPADGGKPFVDADKGNLYAAEFPVHSFNTLQSPNAGSAPAGLVNVKQEIEAAYGVIGLDSPPAQFAVLKLPKSPGIVVPFSTASGKQLYRFDISYTDQKGYFVEKYDRCSIAKAKIDEGNPTTIGCPLCGASGDPCCTSNPECNGANNYCKQSTRECTPCGTLNKDCCPTGTPCTEEGTVCDPSGTNKCVPCGAATQPCCSAEPRCPTEWTKCNNEFCEACGGLNQDTCPTGVPCREGSPSGGKCTNYRLYTVTCQDCLSAIAQKCFFDMGEWPVICQHNKDVGRLPQDRDCGLIYVEEILEIPPYSGDQACANACACPAACCGGCC